MPPTLVGGWTGWGYKEIKPEMTSNERTVLFVAGLLGGNTGTALGIIKYAKDMIDPNEPDWYDEEDFTDGIMVRPRMFFEWTEIPNWRDNIIIPWYRGSFDRAARSVKVNCPEMTFPKAGTYNIVFRIDYFIALFKVRYDVALPIAVA